MSKNDPLQADILEVRRARFASVGSKLVAAGILSSYLPILALSECEDLGNVNIDGRNDDICVLELIPTLAGL